jgi:hypothetical protein
MTSVKNREGEFKNADSPFTELFTLLFRDENLPNNFSSRRYDIGELQAMHQHADNAVAALLQGLQDIGILMSLAAQDKKKMIEELKTIGFFITIVTNLAEALHILQLNASCVLGQRIASMD